MKKIIAALDGLQFSDSTKAYAIELAKHSNTHLVGVFLDDFTYTSYKVYDVITGGGNTEAKLKQLEEKDKETRKAAVVRFETACAKASINYSLHHDKSIALQELLRESIYADMVVIDRKETLTHYSEKPPTRFIRDFLTDVQCPVLLTPSRYRPIEKIMLLYDGEPSSVYAIKMFSYMLPYLKHLPVEVLSVKGPAGSLHVPDNKLMKEFMKRHFPGAVYTVLKGIPETEIITHLRKEQQELLLVLGAYRRGMVSRWFRQSMADVLMKELKVPLFIAHNK